jgi:hypothetical protein
MNGAERPDDDLIALNETSNDIYWDSRAIPPEVHSQSELEMHITKETVNEIESNDAVGYNSNFD